MKANRLGRVLQAALLLMVLFMLSGCWDRKELEDISLVLALGLDKGLGNGVIVTTQIAIPSKLGSQQGGGGEGPTTVVTAVQGATVPGAFNLFNTYMGRRLSIQHARAIIISEELAKDPQAVSKTLGSMVRYRETRRTMLVIVVKGKAGDFLKANQPLLEANPARYLEDLATAQGNTGMLPAVSLYHYYLDDIIDPGREPITLLGASKPTPLKKAKGGPKAGSYTAGTLPRDDGNKTELLGAAVFRQKKMVGEINGEETRIFNMINGDFRRAFISFKDPLEKKAFLPIDLRQGSLPVVKVDLKGSRPVINVQISLEGELMGIPSDVNYATDLNKQRFLEKYVAKVIHTRSLALIKRTQTEFKSDIFGFGEKIRRKFWTYPEWVKFNWPKKYPDAEVHVKVDFNIRRTGLTLAPQ